MAKKRRSWEDYQKKKIKRGQSGAPIVILLVLLVIACASLGVVAWVCLRPVTLPHVQPNQAASTKAPVEYETWEATEAAADGALVQSSDPVIQAANLKAMQYDYDGAIAQIQSIPGYADNETYVSCIQSYESLKSQAVQWTDYDKITHIFFHSLIVDSELAFASYKSSDYDQVMTTVEEFKDIMQSMYDKGYVLISLHKIAKMETQPDGTVQMVQQPIYLPRGKKPFVLSEDDVCYYEYMTGTGFATKLCLDENGKVVNEYVERDGSVSYGSYDVLTVLEDFIETHPDFSYQGSKGILAFTGYDGILGYRTSDFWYNENCDYYVSTPANDKEKREDHTSPNENIEQDKQTAREVAQAIRDLGWELASHSWGHLNMTSTSYEHLVWDTDMWEREVESIIGDTDIILYPLGADVGDWRPSQYTFENEKFKKLWDVGFRYFCNVDSTQYWLQYGSNYMRQGRRNMDGQMMFKQMVYPEKVLTSDLFDVYDVFDRRRPLPVNGITVPEDFDLRALADSLGMSDRIIN